MLNVNFTLAENRQIALVAAYTSATYENLLEGEPNFEISERAVLAKKAIANLLWENERVVVLKCESDPKGVLPKIAYIGKFISFQPARDLGKMASSLVVIWFKEDLSSLNESIDDKLLERINWFRDARDFDW